MIKVTVNNLRGLIESLDDIEETCESGVEVGVGVGGGASEETALASKVLEHRWHSEGPDSPAHWQTGGAYVTWAFVARTAKTMEEIVLPEVAQALLDTGVTGEDFWNNIGRETARIMKMTMRGVMAPPNAQSTIEQKGYNNPLIDEGEMLNSIGWRVGTESEEEATDYPEEVPPAF